MPHVNEALVLQVSAYMAAKPRIERPLTLHRKVARTCKLARLWIIPERGCSTRRGFRQAATAVGYFRRQKEMFFGKFGEAVLARFAHTSK